MVSYINTNVSNLEAYINDDSIKVYAYNYHAVDITVFHDKDDFEELNAVIDWDIDSLHLELDSGAVNNTTIKSVDPYGLIAYIKAAY